MKKLLYPLLLITLILTAGCSGNEPPVAYIDSISPSSVAAGETVTFTGHGTDTDGTVVGYKWRSSIDGDIGSLASFDSSALSEGAHIIYLTVQDNNDARSEEVEGIVIVGAAAGSTAGDDFEVTPDTTPESSTPGASPHINYLTAEPAVISPGGSSLIKWSVSNAKVVVGSYGSTVLVLPKTGSGTVRPARTTNYTVWASNGASTVRATVTVTVQSGGTEGGGVQNGGTENGGIHQASLVPIINSFTASPATISRGGSSTLSWDVSNATQLTLSQQPFPNGNIFYSPRDLTDMNGSWELSPNTAIGTTITFVLTAKNAAGETSKTAAITVQEEDLTLWPPKTLNLSNIPEESGCINPGVGVGNLMCAGDDSINTPNLAFASFNVSTLAGKDIEKAELICKGGSVSGHPWPDLGTLGIYQVKYGPRPLRLGDNTLPGQAIVLNLSQSALSNPINITKQVEQTLANKESRFQVRLSFIKKTDNDDDSENCCWEKVNLKVEYR